VNTCTTSRSRIPFGLGKLGAEGSSLHWRDDSVWDGLGHILMPNERGMSKWLDLFRSASQLLAGLKLTAAFMTFFGIGTIGQWLITTFYPFTRLLWGDLFLWLKLPDISSLEKDALTALLFFLPLGLSSLISAAFGNRDDGEIDGRGADRLTAIVFGLLFFLIICGGLITNLLRRVQ